MSGPSPSFGSFVTMIKVKYAGASLRDCASELGLLYYPNRRIGLLRMSALPLRDRKASFGKGSFICRSQRVGMENKTCVAPAAQSTAFNVDLRNSVVLRSVRSPTLQMLCVLIQTDPQ